MRGMLHLLCPLVVCGECPESGSSGLGVATSTISSQNAHRSLDSSSHIPTPHHQLFGPISLRPPGYVSSECSHSRFHQPFFPLSLVAIGPYPHLQSKGIVVFRETETKKLPTILCSASSDKVREWKSLSRHELGTHMWIIS